MGQAVPGQAELPPPRAGAVPTPVLLPALVPVPPSGAAAAAQGQDWLLARGDVQHGDKGEFGVSILAFMFL